MWCDERLEVGIEIDQCVGVDIPALMENAINGKRRVVETVVHSVGIRKNRAVFGVVQIVHMEMSSAFGKSAHAIKGGVDALHGIERCLWRFSLEPQIECNRFTIKVGARTPDKIKHP